MAIDKYQPCPCGSGKKIKFCCTADLLGELEKLQRMLDGEQRLACLEHIVHLLEKHPRVPALLSIKAMLENELGNVEQADKTIDELLEVMPNSPVAMAERARLMAGQGQAVEAARCLQHALNAAEEAFPVRVYNVLGFVAGALLERGLFAAARAHFLLQVSLGGKDDPSGASLLMELNSAPGVSLLLKQDTRFAEAAEGASYKREFDEAMELVGRARWLAGHDKLAALAEKHGRDPAIRHNLAMLRCFLGQEEDAAKSWRICSSLTEPTSLEDAVEAEAMAQLLDGRPLGAEVPIV
ncbi:MAG: hypothetical protein KDA41_02195, partial [Planctomycetales bacterium]|nr:hypothetical protein [Planctomycetales bacterium]